MAETADRRPRERVDDIVRGLPEFRAPGPKTYLEWAGIVQMSVVLGVICIVTLLFLVAWWATRPAIKDAEALLRAASTPGGQLDADKLIDTLGKLQRDHTEHFRNLFQLLVMSALTPLFTLLAGYVFGRSQAASSQPDSRDGPER